MYTLKIKWYRTEGEHYEKVDESTMFIPCDVVNVHGEITHDEQMKDWPEGSYFDYRVSHHPVPGGMEGFHHLSGRRIAVDRRISANGVEHTTYLATHAWLLGPDGKTIERIAP